MGCVFADERDGNGVMQVILAVSEGNPVLPHLLAMFDEGNWLFDGLQSEQVSQRVDKLLLLEQKWHMVGSRYVVHGKDLLALHLTHVGDLVNGDLLDWLVAACGNLVTSLVH